MLAFDQACHEHDTAIGEFERVVVNVRRFRVDLAETRHPRRHRIAATAENVIEFHVAFECELCAGPQADCDTGIILRSEATRNRIPEAGGDQAVADLRRARGNMFKAVIAHWRTPLATPTGHAPRPSP